MLRRARKYTKRIDIYFTNKISDGFGGNRTQENYLYSLWVMINTLNANSSFNNRQSDLGTYDKANSLRLLFRYNPQLDFNYKNMYFVYEGSKYFIQTKSVEINETKSEVEIFATRQNDVIIGDNFFNLYKTYVERVNSLGGMIENPTCLQNNIKEIYFAS